MRLQLAGTPAYCKGAVGRFAFLTFLFISHTQQSMYKYLQAFLFFLYPTVDVQRFLIFFFFPYKQRSDYTVVTYLVLIVAQTTWYWHSNTE